jgi:DNA-binding HxlR family transcriptional regulator
MAAEPAHPRRTLGAIPPTTSEKPVLQVTTTEGADPMNPSGLDPLIHGRVRLGIVSALAVHPVLSFPELKELLSTTDGNLSVHARRLEEGGYIACTKGFEGRVPRTEYALTSAGRAALARYLDHMEALIERVRER